MEASIHQENTLLQRVTSKLTESKCALRRPDLKNDFQNASASQNLTCGSPEHQKTIEMEENWQ